MKTILSIAALVLFVASPLFSQSVAEAAKKNRPKAAKATVKRVWTDDDFSTGGSPGEPIPADKTSDSTSRTLEKFRRLDQEQLGAAVLKMAKADVDFPGRRDWEGRLFEAKEAWLTQIERMEGHKDSNKDVVNAEVGLAKGAQSNFERIAGEGIRQAQAVNDPTLKAHLRYQEWARTCLQYSPGEVNGRNLQQECWDNLQSFKSQMQEQGTW